MFSDENGNLHVRRTNSQKYAETAPFTCSETVPVTYAETVPVTYGETVPFYL